MTLILIRVPMQALDEPDKSMYVCVCNAVTDQAIRDAAAAGVSTVCELTMRTGCGACCGSCVPYAASLLDETRRAQSETMASVAIAA